MKGESFLVRISQTIHKAYRTFLDLSYKQKIFLLIVLVILSLLVIILIQDRSKLDYQISPAEGGIYKEGVIGRVETLNPLYADSEAEKTVTGLVYRKLFKYNNEGKLIPDLVSSYKKTDDNQEYQITLKSGLYWSDGREITSQDVVETINVIKSDDYTGAYHGSMSGVEVEANNKWKVKFILANPELDFPHQLSLPIMPSEYIKDIPVEQLPLNIVSRKPISSGPYLFEKVISRSMEHAQISLTKNSFFRTDKKKPYLERIFIYTYPDYESLRGAYRRNEVDGIAYIQPTDLFDASIRAGTVVRELKLPQLTAAFFNLNEKRLKDRKLRKVLAMSIDKEGLVQEVLKDRAQVVEGPLAEKQKDQDRLSVEEAKKILKKIKLKKKSFALITSQDQIQIEIGNRLKEAWQDLGLSIKLRHLTSEEIEQMVIEDRQDYDILLFGYNFSATNNLFPYFYSSQRNEGYNFSNYKSQQTDYYLEQAIDSKTKKEQEKNIKFAAKEIKNDLPALFLYSPYYLHLVGDQVKGAEIEAKIITAQDRFNKIDNWYINEKRELKK